MSKAIVNSVTRAAIAFSLIDQVKAFDKKYAAELDARVLTGLQMLSLLEDSSNAIFIDQMAQTTPRENRQFFDGKEVVDDIDSVRGEAYSYLIRQKVKRADVYNKIVKAFVEAGYAVPEGDLF